MLSPTHLCVLVYLVAFLPVQFLPIYTPSEEEKRNPALFANNVRRLMAQYVLLNSHVYIQYNANLWGFELAKYHLETLNRLVSKLGKIFVWVSVSYWPGNICPYQQDRKSTRLNSSH